MEVIVESMEPERLFAYRWHPYAVDPKVDYSAEPMTLVEFRLEEAPGGTRLIGRRVGLRPAARPPARRGVPHERARAGRRSSRTCANMSRSELAPLRRIGGARRGPAVRGARRRDAPAACSLRLSTGGRGSIARLGARSRVSRQAVTKHLEVLAGAGLIRDSWRGRERVWEIDRARFADALDYLERISRQWDVALARTQDLRGELARPPSRHERGAHADQDPLVHGGRPPHPRRSSSWSCRWWSSSEMCRNWPNETLTNGASATFGATW